MAFEATTVQVDATRNPSDGVAKSPYFREVDYVNADNAASIYEAASAAHPVLVLKVWHVVKTAFGASATIDVGDGSTADLWIANSAITENTAGNVAASTIAGTWYTSPFQIKATLGGTRTGGTGKVIAQMIRF